MTFLPDSVHFSCSNCIVFSYTSILVDVTNIALPVEVLTPRKNAFAPPEFHIDRNAAFMGMLS